MDSVQIQHALQDVNSFLGVYASDLLPFSIVQAGTIIVSTDPHTEPGLHCEAIHFQNPHRTSKRLLFRFLRSVSFYSLYPRFHTTPLYSLAIQKNATPRTYHYSVWRILLPLRSVHGQGLHPPTICGAVCCWNIHQLFCSEFGATLCTQRSGGQCCTNLYKR